MPEMACWVRLTLGPLLCWVHGPRVSGDQAVVRSALVVQALARVIGWRILRWRRRVGGRASPHVRKRE
jgi:hypothetical protein